MSWRTLERIEADAMTAFYLGAPAAERRARGVVVEAHGGARLYGFPGLVPPRIYNRVTMLGVDHACAPGDLDAIAARMAALGQPWQLSLAPATGLVEPTVARGFTAGYAWAKFTRGPEPMTAPVTELAVRQLTPADAAAATAVLGAAYHLPGWIEPWIAAALADPRFDWFGGFAGAELAATGALFTDGTASWLGFAATALAHQRRGGQAAVLAARIARAAARGATTLVVETGVPAEGKPSASWRNLRRAGFTVAYERPNLVPPALTAAVSGADR